MTAETGSQVAAKPARGRAVPGWLLGLACGAAVTLATPSAVMAGLLLAPGLMALVLDREPGRPAARAALMCGAAAAAVPVLGLWQSGLGVAGAVTAASDPEVLAGCWAAQAAGWLVAQLTPLLVRLGLDAAAAATAVRLRAERARYESEWGIPPAEGG
jgi:hypothetical protein